MTRELAELEVDLTNVDINGGYAIHIQPKNKSQIPDATRENNLTSTQASNTAHDGEAAITLILCSPPRYSSELITLSNVSQTQPDHDAISTPYGAIS